MGRKPLSTIRRANKADGRGLACSAGVSLPVELLLATRDVARREEITFSRLVQRALRTYLETHLDMEVTT